MLELDKLGRIQLMDYCFLRFTHSRHQLLPRRRTFPAGFQQAYCCHDFAHIWYCYSGYYKHYIEDTLYECGPGSVVIIPPGVNHALFVPTDSEADLMYVDLGYDIYLDGPVDCYMNTVTNLFLHCQEQDLKHPLPLFVHLSDSSCRHFEEYFSRFALIYGDMKEERLLLLENMEKLMSVPELSIPAPVRPKALKLIEQRLTPIMLAVRYCNAHYGEKLLLTDLLRVSALCQTNFLKLFKQLLNVTSASYIQMLRTSHARVLLGATTFSLSYISDTCGFTNPSHMVSCYRKYCGMSPREGRTVMTEFWSRKNSVKPRVSDD